MQHKFSWTNYLSIYGFDNGDVINWLLDNGDVINWLLDNGDVINWLLVAECKLHICDAVYSSFKHSS